MVLANRSSSFFLDWN